MRTTHRSHRKVVLQLLVSAGLVLGLAGQAKAATFDPALSIMDFALAGLPQTTFLALPGTESLATTGNQPNFAGHRLWMESTIWSTVNFGPGTSLFTGVPTISNLKVTVVNNAGHLEDSFSSAPTSGVPTTHFGHGHQLGLGGVSTGTAVPPQGSIVRVGPTFGGISKLTGQVILEILQGLRQGIPLDAIGGALGSSTSTTVGPLPIRATGHPFVTSTVMISKVTSNIITIPGRAPCFAGATCPTTPTFMFTTPNGAGTTGTGPAPTTGTRVQGVAFTLNVDLAGGEIVKTPWTQGGFRSQARIGTTLTTTPISQAIPFDNHTVTVSGSNQLISGSQAGKVTAVAPTWIDAGASLGNLPAAISLTFEFVPEPGTLLLLISGAAGLAVIGRRRMRK